MATITLRNVKGSPLTNTEVDGNFSLLDKYSHGYLSKSVSANVTLTSDEADNFIIAFTGTLTGNITVSLPNSLQKSWLMYNSTSGGFIVYVKTTSGTLTVPVYSNGWYGVVSNGTEAYASGGANSVLTIGNGLSGGSYNGSSAVTIAVSASNTTTAAAHYPVFSTAQGTSVVLGTNISLQYNPSTNVLTAGTFSGGLSGNATTATTATNISAADNQTAATYYPVFATAQGTSVATGTDSGYTYNPSTNVLTAGTFSGGLSGNATTATTATNISAADNQTAATYYPVFATAQGTSVSTGTDSGYTYNPSTNVLTVTSITGTITKSTNLVGGNNTTLLGSIGYQSNTDTTTLLSPNTTTTKKFLTQTGTGTNGAAPAWGTIVTSDLGTGTANSTTYLRGDLTWATISAGATLSAADTSSTYYIPMTTTTTGSWTDARVDTADMYYSAASSTLYCTNFNSASDERLKSNISIISNSLQTVNQLRGVEFTWNSSGKKSYGVIAQELEKILPDVVDTVDDQKSVNYTSLIGFLIEAVKELSAEISTLKGE